MARCIIGGVLALALGGALLACSAPPSATRASPSVEEVARWQLLGVGEATVEGEVLRLREGAGSKGVMLLSPRECSASCTLRFYVKPESPRGVVAVLLSVSPSAGGELEIPQGYDGALELWQGDSSPLRSYMIAFHTGFHQPRAFVQRTPGAVELQSRPDPAGGEVWYQVEAGRGGRRIWLKVDGELALEATDVDQELPGGRLALRLRGAGDGSFSALFRDFEIYDWPEI
jgi:hypothetical protein